MISPNSMTGQRREAGDALPSPHASALSRHPESLRLGQGEGSAFPAATSGIMSPCPAKLDSVVTHSKQITPHFQIDNFQRHLSEVVDPEQSRRVEPHAPKRFLAKVVPTSSLESRTSSNPNRPSPRLEMPVSYRKQTTGPISNRPKSAVCKIPVLRALIPNSQLSTLDCQLRASDV